MLIRLVTLFYSRRTVRRVANYVRQLVSTVVHIVKDAGYTLG